MMLHSFPQSQRVQRARTRRQQLAVPEKHRRAPWRYLSGNATRTSCHLQKKLSRRGKQPRHVKITSWLWAGWRAIVSSCGRAMTGFRKLSLAWASICTSAWNCCSTSSDAKARPSSVPTLANADAGPWHITAQGPMKPRGSSKIGCRARTNAKMHAKTFSWSRPRCKDMLSPATVLRCRNS